MRLLRFSSEVDWIEAAVRDFIAAALAAKESGRPSCHFCLAGGATPAPLYRRLAGLDSVTRAFDGLAIGLWLGDERAVDADSPARNGLLIASCFQGAAWRPEIHLWPDPGDADSGLDHTSSPAAVAAAAEAAALAYARELAGLLGPRPVFDLALLGLGGDGHTASLFPGDPILELGADPLSGLAILASRSTSPVVPRERMSLSLAALRPSRSLRFFARGGDKLGLVLALAAGSQDYPAGLLASERCAILYCDS